ncbi:DUF4331 family protein [Streptomyces catenulae]|uniref:DUF4331 family protein n=1 Tax=Streptomyces catenulae TaxID=66875 RepID=A0ABV2YZK7_9ACTN|nr:DUF4331 family protein [Streptomyces catenulae]
MSSHLSGPNPRSPVGDARLEITDLFAFAVPGDRAVLIMNVHPAAPTGAAFHPDAVYRIDVDTDGDHRADTAFSFVFSRPENGRQTATVHRAEGPRARQQDIGGLRIFADEPVSSGTEPAVAASGPYLFSAGLRSDSFPADPDGIVRDFRWTGTDRGADRNVLGIALEMPHTELGPGPVIGVWGRVSVRRHGRLTQVDRGAHPLLAAFHAEGAADAYRAGDPADDWDTYREPWAAVLHRTGGYPPRAAEEALRTVLPDILRYDRAQPAAYPNGRTLTDDVTSARLAMLSGGSITTRGIGPHTDLLPDFPYLGHPHPAPPAG